ncbi:MAG: type II secretion system protein [Phycisphaerales bacterium]|jgi:prepilin-type N-terminal cleavage/methylation domain-containing protein|nr:type II secretion system protein [Phycisphaerales bacterium]
MKSNIKHGFTIIEMLVVISIIALLMAFLLVAVNSGRQSANTAKATIKLKQIGEWMQLWSGENKNRVLPSQFDYTDEVEAGSQVTTRTDEHASDDNLFDDITRGRYQGTWADILWTENKLNEQFGLTDREQDEPDHLLWEADSPDNSVYDLHEYFDHPFRSTLLNSRGPYKGMQGFFAANDFFDSRSGQDIDSGDSESTRSDRYYTYEMIHAPSRSVYLVDSIAGETISDEEEPWVYDFVMNSDGQLIDPSADTDGEVDYRYGDSCMILLLDGSIKMVEPWSERGPLDPPSSSYDPSLYGLGYRVHQLTRRKPVP